MKFLVLNLFFTFCVGSSVEALPNDGLSVEASTEVAFGGIVMVEDLHLRVDSQNASILVSDIKIFSTSGTLVMHIAGCNLQECINDISVLATGTYEVTVELSNGNTFTRTIVFS
ncbi:MAG: hypothetical protein AAF849_22495 [Bacteroidota bacterium]